MRIDHLSRPTSSDVGLHTLLAADDLTAVCLYIVVCLSVSIVDSTEVLCPRFDETEIFMPGDSPSIFPSLDKI